MNLKKIKKQINKINRTVEFLSDEDEWTQVEKDLLLDYVRSLYATIDAEEVEEIEENEFPTSLLKKEEIVETIEEEVVEAVEDEIVEDEVSDEIKALFEWHEARELKDKLSKSRIEDLTKVFSINERIFTINELFDGDQNLFNSTLEKINNMNSYDEAKNYLIHDFAIKNEWNSVGHIKKATKFIHLIQRKFA